MDKDLEWLKDIEPNYFDLVEVGDLVRVNHLTDLGEEACYNYDYCGDEYDYSGIVEGSICVVGGVDYLERYSSDCGSSMLFDYDPDEIVKSIELFTAHADGRVIGRHGFWFHNEMVNLLPVGDQIHK